MYFHFMFLSADCGPMGGSSYHQVVFCYICVIPALKAGRQIQHLIVVSVDFLNVGACHTARTVVIEPQLYCPDFRVLL